MSEHDHDNHASHGATYFMVFCALCVFTAISVVADLVHLPSKIMLAAIVLAVAVAKALCVMLFFMHLKFERAWKYLLLAPTIIIAAALPVALRPDIGMSYYVADVQQLHDYPETSRPNRIMAMRTLRTNITDVRFHSGFDLFTCCIEHFTVAASLCRARSAVWYRF